MKIVVLEVKNGIRKLLIAALITAVLSFFSLLGMKTIGVYSSVRQLPIYSVDCKEKKAAITFDCAWGSSDIPSILDVLGRENVRATFFIVGQWAEKYPDKVRMIAEGGHDVANHSYSHLRMGALNTEKIRSEILKCGNTLTELTGRKIELFRAPYGDYSNNVVSIAGDLGYFTIQWNVDSLDWKPEISSSEILDRIRRKTVPGSIILFHNDTLHTAKLLPQIISLLKSDGYELVPVSELIIRSNYSIDHEGKQKPN